MLLAVSRSLEPDQSDGKWSASPNRNAGKLQVPARSRLRCSDEQAAAFLVGMIPGRSHPSVRIMFSWLPSFVRQVEVITLAPVKTARADSPVINRDTCIQIRL
jgi:hypothetical protein